MTTHTESSQAQKAETFKAKHTPGPWEIAADGEGVLSAFVPEPRRAIIRVCDTRLEWQSRAERKANAHLIAAAPEMLAMLSKLVEYQTPDDAEIIRRLIAKAEGQ